MLKHVLVVGVLLLALGAREAEACSCRLGPLSPFDVLPRDGAVDVPLNTLIWVGGDISELHPDLPAPRVLAPGGEELEMVATVVGGGMTAATVFVPNEPLLPGAEYLVDVNESVRTSFTTGTSEDNVAPALPSVAARSTATDLGYIPFLGDTCPPWSVAQLELDADDGVHFLVFGDQETLAFDPLRGEALHFDDDPQLTLRAGGCNQNWEQGGPLSSATVRVGTADLAGNFSGWSPLETVTTPPPGCSCAAIASPKAKVAPGLGAALLLIVAASRRRSSTRTARQPTRRGAEP